MNKANIYYNAKMSFDNVFDLTARVYFYSYDIPGRVWCSDRCRARITHFFFLSFFLACPNREPFFFGVDICSLPYLCCRRLYCASAPQHVLGLCCAPLFPVQGTRLFVISVMLARMSVIFLADNISAPSPHHQRTANLHVKISSCLCVPHERCLCVFPRLWHGVT